MSKPTNGIIGKRFRWVAMNRSMLTFAIVAIAIGVATILALAITPSNGGMVSGTTIGVDTTGGDQLDPHVSGNIAALYRPSDPSGSGEAIL